MSSYSSGDSWSSNTSKRRSKMELHYEGMPRFCNCKVDGRRLKAPRMTSWTSKNPGRRFYGCINWEQKDCGYFEWHDEPMTARAKDVISMLLHENLTLLNERKKIKTRASNEVDDEIAELWDELERFKIEKARESVK